MKERIVLIGFMGTGKSTVGKALAAALRLPFFDTDSLVEETAGKTIGDIFLTEGEESFRRQESAALDTALASSAAVIATGGGIILRAENREKIKEKAFSVRLVASPAEIYERIKDDASRPLLDTPEPQKRMAEIIAFREEYYAMADTELNTEGLTPEECAERIIALRERRE